MNQPFRRRHGGERGDLAAAARLAKDEHVVGVAAKVGDVVPDPLQAELQIEHAREAAGGVARAAQLGQVQIAEHIEAVIEAHHHHIAATRQILAVIGLQLLAGAGREAAAVEPDHDGALLVVVYAGRPDVGAQAILARDAVVPLEDKSNLVEFPSCAGPLRGHRPVLHGTAHAGPRLGFGGRQETGAAVGGRPVGNTFERIDSLGRVAVHFAGRGFHDALRRGGQDQRAAHALRRLRCGRKYWTPRDHPTRSGQSPQQRAAAEHDFVSHY